MDAHETSQLVNDALRAYPAIHVDRQTLACVLIDHGETLEDLAVGAAIEHEVIGPHLVRTRCGLWPGS